MSRLNLFLFFFLFSFSASAQNFIGSFHVGLNQARFTDGHWSFNKSGLNIGVGVEKKVYLKSYLSFNIQYSQKGETIADTFSFYNLRTNYIEVPFKVIFYLPYYFNVNLGVSYGHLVSYKEHFDAPYSTLLPLSQKEFALTFGLGYMLADYLQLKLIYSGSLVYVSENHGNSLFSFILYFSFPNRVYKDAKWRREQD